jgi:hypothetical protein
MKFAWANLRAYSRHPKGNPACPSRAQELKLLRSLPLLEIPEV